MATPPWKRPAGHPSALTDVITVRPDGTEVTTADKIIQSLRTGNYFEHAAASGGVPKSTAYDWLRVGARTNRSIFTGKTTPADHTQHELDCASFSDAVDIAEAESLAEDIALTQLIARGGRTRTIETVKTDANNVVTERSTRTEPIDPDGAMIRWRLERRHPKLFGRQLIELSGPDGGPLELTVEEKRTALLAQMDVLAGRIAEESDWEALIEDAVIPAELPEGSPAEP